MDELKALKKDIEAIKASIEAIKNALKCLSQGPYVQTGELNKFIEEISVKPTKGKE